MHSSLNPAPSRHTLMAHGIQHMMVVMIHNFYFHFKLSNKWQMMVDNSAYSLTIRYVSCDWILYLSDFLCLFGHLQHVCLLCFCITLPVFLPFCLTNNSSEAFYHFFRWIFGRGRLQTQPCKPNPAHLCVCVCVGMWWQLYCCKCKTTCGNISMQ